MKSIKRCVAWIGGCAIGAASLAPGLARADEGGVAFWLSGQMGSFSALPGEPGFSLPAIYYHASADASGSRNFIIGGLLTSGIDARVDLAFFAPTYTFKEPVLGGQAAVSLGWGAGTYRVSANVAVAGPQGNTVERSASDKTSGGSDLYPMATLKWHDGRNNWMTYVTGDIPTGAYQAGRLANIGIGHGAIDAGGGYTYLDPAKGHEFSAVGGFTYNFENDDTDYQNGVDSHIDWAASQFLNEQVHVGLVGYLYQQLSGDRGSGARLGDFKSRVFAAGPQVGYFFPVGKEKGYVNLKGYWEFGAENRAEGWNLWVSLALPLSVGK